MHHSLPSSDPKLLHEGLALIEGMRLTAMTVCRDTAISKQNREIYRRKQDALQEVIRHAYFHLQDRGVGC